MNKVNRPVEEWALSRGIPTPYDNAVMVNQEGYYISVGYLATASRFAASVPVEPSTWTKDAQKSIKSAMKGIGKVLFDKTKSVVHLLYKSNSRKKIAEYSDTAVQTLPFELRAQGVAPKMGCFYCGQPGSDSQVEKLETVYPAHLACQQQQMGREIADIEDNLANGNYVLGFIMAILGGIVGGIPSIIVLYLGYISGWLFALIPMAALFGYKLGKGKQNGFMTFSVIIASVIDIAMVYFLYFYVVLCIEMQSVYPVGAFFEIVSSGVLWSDSDFIGLMGQIGLFGLLGIFIASGSIRSTHKKRLQELKMAHGMSAPQPYGQHQQPASQGYVPPAQSAPIPPVQPTSSSGVEIPGDQPLE